MYQINLTVEEWADGAADLVTTRWMEGCNKAAEDGAVEDGEVEDKTEDGEGDKRDFRIS